MADLLLISASRSPDSGSSVGAHSTSRPRPLGPFAALSALLFLTACGQEQQDRNAGAAIEQASAESGSERYGSGRRDRLCLQRSDGGQAAFITYAASGEANCTVKGRFDLTSQSIVPEGDEACRIPVRLEGADVVLGDGGPACTYYCGPNASFASRRFMTIDPSAPVADLAGDPLC